MTTESRTPGDLTQSELAIIRSAYRTIARGGSQRMSLREIAEDAGVSKALLLYHFGSKDNLLLAAMKWAVERTEQRIRERLEVSSGAPDQITALVEAIFVGPEANRDFYAFYLDLVEHVARVPGFGSLSQMLDEIINGLYSEVAEAGIEEGVFEVSDLAGTARSMRAVIEGTFVQWIQTPDWRDNHAEWKEGCRRALLRLLGVRPG
jgi:AcrR family transcriptional regulator